MRTSAARGAGVAAVLAVVLMLAGCSSGGVVDAQGPVTPAPTAAPTTHRLESTPSPSAPGTTAMTPEGANILRQYKAFFASLPLLSKASDSARFAAMQQLATDPELTRVLGGMAASTHVGEVFYGRDIVRPVIISIVGGVARIADCQDTSGSGREKLATGEKVTVGVKNTLANVTMKRGPDGAWRVATIENQQAGSCTARA